MVTIYDGLIQNKSIGEIHKELLSLTIVAKKGNKLIDPVAYKNALKATSRLKKQLGNTKNLKKEQIADNVFTLFGVIALNKVLTQNTYKRLNDIEGKEKNIVINETLKINENNDKVFYLASSHRDSASDHKDAQGKYYIDENWRSTIKNKELRHEIGKFVRVNKIQTVQYITGRPVWFITRPNCRHYLASLPTDRVLMETKQHLIRSYKTNRAIGDRQYLQTLQSGKDRKVIGEARNAELMIQKYKERLEQHTDLYKTYKSNLVRQAIVKDKQLISKWQSYLEKLL